MSLVLRTRALEKRFGPLVALHPLDLELASGSALAVLGPNGAGKSTLLRLLAGLARPSAGSIELHPAGRSRSERRRGVGLVGHATFLTPTLTTRENLVLAAREKEFDAKRLDWIFGLFPAIQKFWNALAGNLSGGQKQMLAISRAIVEPRKLLLVDEPTKGLAPAIISNMVEAFRELKRTDTTLLVVEQNFHFARSLGDTVAVMDSGRIAHTGRMDALASDEALQTRLLGLSLDSAPMRPA